MPKGRRYTAAAVANYILDRAERDGRPITPLKLIKLVFIAYGWALAALDRKLFDESIEAWRYGPVIPSLYHEFKHYGRRPIDGRALDLDLGSLEVREPELPRDDEDARLVIDKVWAAYGRVKAEALVRLTHRQESPWAKAYGEGENAEIDDTAIKDYYRRELEELLDGV